MERLSIATEGETVRIWSTEIQSTQLPQTQRVDKECARLSLGTDRLVLSKQAEDVQEIKKYLSELPSIREEKIDNLRRAIEAGEYRVSEYELAGAMIEDMMDLSESIFAVSAEAER